jgi:hypothetical protein
VQNRRMIYLIGADHSAHASKDGSAQTEGQRKYAGVLRERVELLKPVLIGEEYSEAAERENGTISITRLMYPALHRFCEPTDAERKAQGYLGPQDLQRLVMDHGKNRDTQTWDEAVANAWAICAGKYFVIRERMWIERIKDAVEQDLIFVCGEMHLNTFPMTLQNAGLKSEIAARGIGVTPEQQALADAAFGFLAEHPDCIEEF